MLLNLALKTWVFPNADRYTYYAPVANCEGVPAESRVKMVECEPGYAEKQMQMEEQNRKSQKQRDAAQALAMLVVAAPVWWFHWRLARKEV